VCACTLGFFGAACEFPNHLKHRPPVRPAIYVYTLPPGYNVYLELEAHGRNTGWWLWRALLESPHRTFSPYEADYFFVPCFPIVSVEEDILLRALEYVQAELPYWNATRGHNHLVVGAWDFGLARIAGLPVFDRLLQLSHFGWVNTTRQWQTTVDGRCPAWQRNPTKPFVDCHSFTQSAGPRSGPHRPGIDLVVPDIMELRFKQDAAWINNASVVRSTTVFFSGGPTNVWREDVYALHRNVSGWRVEHSVNLAQGAATSVFCLDLSAAGFSSRFAVWMVAGCIPVWLDELEQPWESVLPLHEFTVRFGPHEVARLPELIANISADDIARLQRGVAAHRHAYHWRPLFGPLPGEAAEGGEPDAWDTLMRTLERRIGN
jgi:hypothetical protein